MNSLGSNLNRIWIGIGLSVALFWWTVDEPASAGEKTNSCAEAARLEMLSSSHIFEKACSISAASADIDFFLARASMRDNPLLSSKLKDYLASFPSASYKLDRVGSGNLYQLSVIGDDLGEIQSPLGVSSYLLMADEDDIWVRCNDKFDRKCSIYQDVADFNEESEWEFCRIEIIAKVPNPPSEEILNIAIKSMESISEDLRNSRSSDMINACNRRGD